MTDISSLQIIRSAIKHRPSKYTFERWQGPQTLRGPVKLYHLPCPSPSMGLRTNKGRQFVVANTPLMRFHH